MTKKAKEDAQELCPSCKNPAHKPGQSEFSNCGESEISHSRFDTDFTDPFIKNDRHADQYV